MVRLRKITLRFRKVPHFVWRLATIAAMMACSAIAWWIPFTHAWLATQLGVADASPLTVPADVPTAALADRVTSLEQKVADAQQEVANDSEKMTALESDFQKATSDVAASTVILQKQTAEIATLAQQVQSQQGTVSTGASSTSEPSAAAGKISINTGTAAQLDSLPGIGPTYAQRIVDYRTAHGPYKTIDDLTNVSGIGPATLDKIRDLIEL